MKGKIPDEVMEVIELTPSQKERYERFLSSFIPHIEAETAGMYFGSSEYGEVVAFDLIKHLKAFEREIREEERARVMDRENVDVV